MNGKTIALYLACVVLAQMAGAASAAESQPNAERVRAAFERLKRQGGTWTANSTKGWEGDTVIRVLARGSVVLYTSEFHEVAGHGMATTMFIDRGTLKLTHYCEARNQPTLVATSISADGKRITFEFLSGTGMQSRDKGHMDKLVLELVDEDHYTEHWTWYQDGKERWLEQINYLRKK